jgi:hypothetical protein
MNSSNSQDSGSDKIQLWCSSVADDADPTFYFVDPDPIFTLMRIRILLFVRICLLTKKLRICDTDRQTLHGSSLHGSLVSLDGSIVSHHGSIVSHHGSIVSLHSSLLSHFGADEDPDTALHFDANSDPASQNDAGPDPDPHYSVRIIKKTNSVKKV